MAREKTFVSQGPEGSIVVIEGSADGGATFAPVGIVRPQPNPGTVKVPLALTHVRARNIGILGAIFLAIGAELAAQNLFVPLAVGGPASDVSLIEEEKKSVVVTGEYTGVLVIDVSEDDIVFTPAKAFDTGQPDTIVLVGTFKSARARLVGGFGNPTVVVAGDQGTPGGGVESAISENVTNASGSSLMVGEVVRISANDAVARSQADVPANLQGTVGVVMIGGANGVTVTITTDGKARVLLEPALVPVAGQTLFVSATIAGSATNVAPVNALSIGIIKDTSSYATDGTVVADVDTEGVLGAGGAFPGYGALTPTSVDVGDTGTPGVSALVSRSDHEHPVPAPAVAPPDVAAVSAIGAATTPARSDHTHGGVSSIDTATGAFITGAPGPTSVDIGDAAVVGTAATLARADHQHAVPAPAVAPPAITAAGAVGVATTPARSDHTHSGVTSVNGNVGVVTVGSFLLWGNNSVAAAADTRVLAPGYDRTTANISGSETGGGSEGAWRAPRAGTILNLRVRHNAAVGNGNAVVYTLRVNGILTALTASRVTGVIGDSSDLVNSVAVVAGDLIEMVASKALGIGAGGVVCQVAVEFRPT